MPAATAPARDGYLFLGYWDAISGGTQYYNADMSSAKNWDKAAETTLYARWSTDSYTITYNLNGGDNHSSNPSSYSVDTPTITLQSPTRTNYTFGGWYNNADLTGSGVSEIPTGSTGNKEFWAKWTGNQYTVTFDKQDGTGGSDNVTVTYGSAMPTASAPSRAGYTFAGYWDAASGGIQYYDFINDAMVSVRNWDKPSNTTLYAHWGVTRSGLVSEWLFSGNAIDTGGSGNNGTVNGAVLSSDRHGNSNSAYTFAAANTIVLSSASGFPTGASPRAFSFWVKANNPTVADYNCIFFYGNSNLWADFSIYATEINELGWDPHGGFITQIASDQCLDNTWHHVVVLYDGTNAKIYVDSALKSSNSRSIDTILGSTAVIGKPNEVSSTIEGALDDIRLYNRALTDVEIEVLFHEGGW